MRNESISDISVQYLKGVGPARKKLFGQLGVSTVEDLLYFFPRRYEDRRKMTPLSAVKEGEWQTVTGKIVKADSHQAWYTKKHVSEAVIYDGTAQLVGIWFNQPYISQYLHAGERVILYGKVERYKDRLQMVAPEYEIIGEEDEALSIDRIVPIYPLTQGMSQRYLRRIIKTCLDKYASQLKDVLPYTLRQKYSLENLVKSLIQIHFPDSFEFQEIALKRISFEEFFMFQVSVILRRLSIIQKKGIAHKVGQSRIDAYIKSFAFELTNAQRRVIGEIAEDMAKDSPMHRLLQGDVGCGKTLVALFGAFAARENGFQSAFMAPTEILARQHYETVMSVMQAGPFKAVRTKLLTSSTTKAERERIYAELKSGNIDLLIGTHALIQEGLDFKRLSYVIIDEQHKFGVRQRALLPAKGTNPDTLIMTATPIPRTLCLTLYGDLDISRIDEMPPGRGSVETLHFREENAGDAYSRVSSLVKEGKQAYIIYPIIEESAKLDLKAAQTMFEQFQKEIFKDFRVGLIHGRMKRKDAEGVMALFKKKEIDILVATTILEVGIDVPDANVMVIEHADRFGLSQLHQLRGRIGRSESDALCILIADPASPDAAGRLNAILSTNDGFKIAEKDLLIRGPGEFFGRYQHGLNELKVANPMTQIDLLQQAREEAIKLTESDPLLETPGNKEIKAVIQKRYPTYLELVRAG